MKKNVFVYPVVPLSESTTKNPYINDLIESLEVNGFNVVNKADTRKLGVISIFKYYFQVDIFYFNWIEYLSEKRWGMIQTFLFILQIFLIKISRKTIVYTLHNVTSHYSNSKIYNIIQYIMFKCSNLIVIHSKESIKLLSAKGIKNSKIFYFFHPFNNKRVLIKDERNKNEIPTYDILIWGAMNKYKGALEFVKFVKDRKLSYRIHLAGKFSDESYYDQVKSSSSPFTSIDNKFIDQDELIKLHNQSRFVLFPYNGVSVLNSGALIYSLLLNTPIIGPEIGAFKELGTINIINTFSSLDDVIKILNSNNTIPDFKLIDEFVERSSWKNFGESLSERLAIS